MGNRDIDDSWRIELVERRSAWFIQPCWLIFEKCLVRSNFSRLRGAIHSGKSLQTLPTHPTELMVVPHADKRPARAGILQIRVVQIVTVDRSVVPDIGWNMKVADPFPVFVADDVAKSSIVHPLRPVFRIPDDFVNEVTQVKHEPQLILLRGSFVLEDHPPVSILRTLVCILTRHECKSHRLDVVVGRRSPGSSHTAAVAVRIREAVPINVCRPQPADEHSTGPIRSCGDRGVDSRNDLGEGLILRNLRLQLLNGIACHRGTTSPEQYAITFRVAGRYSLSVVVSSLVPRNFGATGQALSPGCACSQRDCGLKEGPPGNRRHEFATDITMLICAFAGSSPNCQ